MPRIAHSSVHEPQAVTTAGTSSSSWQHSGGAARPESSTTSDIIRVRVKLLEVKKEKSSSSSSSSSSMSSSSSPRMPPIPNQHQMNVLCSLEDERPYWRYIERGELWLLKQACKPKETLPSPPPPPDPTAACSAMMWHVYNAPGRNARERRGNRERSIERLLQTPEFHAAKSPNGANWRSRSPSRQAAASAGGMTAASAGGKRLHQPGEEDLEDAIERMLCKTEPIREITIHENLLVNGRGEDFGYDDVQLVQGRLSTITLRVDQYYIGICCSPSDRWTGRGDRGCHAANWDEMVLLAAGDAPKIGKLEKTLLETALCDSGKCANKGKGGEHCAPRGVASFLYVVVLRLE